MEQQKLISSRWAIAIVFVLVAIVMTIYEGIKEAFYKGTLTPWESHTITIIVTAILASITAAFMRSWYLSLYIKAKELAIKEQSLKFFNLVVPAANHIVNNVLNFLQIVEWEIENNGQVSEESLALLKGSINDAAEQMNILNNITKPSDPESYKQIYPQ